MLAFGSEVGAAETGVRTFAWAQQNRAGRIGEQYAAGAIGWIDPPRENVSGDDEYPRLMAAHETVGGVL